MSEPSQEIIELAKEALSGADISNITAEQAAQLSELFESHEINHIAAEMLADGQAIQQTLHIGGQELDLDPERIQSHMLNYMNIKNASLSFDNGRILPPDYVAPRSGADPAPVIEEPDDKAWTVTRDANGNAVITFNDPNNVNRTNLEQAIQEVKDTLSKDGMINTKNLVIDYGNGHVADLGIDLVDVVYGGWEVHELADALFDEFLEPSPDPNELMKDIFLDDDEPSPSDEQAMNIEDFTFLSGDISIAQSPTSPQTDELENLSNINKQTPPTFSA